MLTPITLARPALNMKTLSSIKPNCITLGSDCFTSNRLFQTSLCTHPIQERLEELVSHLQNNDDLSGLANVNRIGEGTQGCVFSIPDLGLAVKISHQQKSASSFRELHNDFRKEVEALKRVPETLSNCQQLVAYVKVKDGMHCLVTTLKQGTELGTSPIK